MNSKLTLVYSNNDKKLYLYKPRLTAMFYRKFERQSFGRRLRYIYEFFHHKSFQVYYLEINGIMIGHCVVIPGGRRMPGTKINDIVIGGPYYIVPEYRGRGYGKELISLTLKYCKYDYCYAYDYIKKTNIASIKTTEACGFEKYAEAKISGVFHKISVVDSEGTFNLYRYSKNE